MTDEAMIVIPAGTGPDGVAEVRQHLLDRIGAGGAPLTVELDAPQATAIALQLAAACRKTLVRQARFGGFGPICHRLLVAPVPA